MNDDIEKRLSNLESHIAVLQNDLKWIKWLLGIELPTLISLIIGVAKLLLK
jgi:hypothetical protein